MRSPRMTRPSFRHALAPALAVCALASLLAVATAASADGSDWPRPFESAAGTFVIYEPQAEDLRGDQLDCRAAFSLAKRADAPPMFGVLWFTERISIDRDSSTVRARDLDVTKVRLPDITPADASRYEQMVEAEAKDWDLSGSLEELRAGLAATERERASVADLSHTPPRILFKQQRALLVVYDGAPLPEPIEGTRLERVANTPFAVVYDPATRDFYLSGANVWYTAKDAEGPWGAIRSAPEAVRAVMPPDTESDDQVTGTSPVVITATEPTELISTDGPPRYAPLAGGELLYVTNTESDVLREIDSQALYVLLSGRWYRALSPEGPWSFVPSDQLPASFKRIPPDSPKGNVLASIQGTDQAEDAVADAEIPQTSAIKRGGNDLEVDYDGAPQFEPIEHTNLRYAVNTDAEVILADGRYYVCDAGVWYVSDRPDGPWSVSETRPLGLDDVPPSCPVYNVRYVYVFDATPDVIFMGYLPGYIGCYPYDGTVVYGTGYRYKAWRGPHHCYPRPWTWGFHARYNPWLSRWSFGFSYSSGFLRLGTRWHSPREPVRRHAPPQWFGPGGFRRPLLDANRLPVRFRGPGLRRPGEIDRAPANLYNRPENRPRVDLAALRGPAHPLWRPGGEPTRLPNDVFAGKDGKVYQRDAGGGWRVNEGRTWKPAQLPVAPNPPGSAGSPPSGSRQLPPTEERPLGRLKPRPMPAPAQLPVSAPVSPPMREPARREWPPQRPPQPRTAPAPRPEPPRVSPVPGNLEREFHARERARPEPAATPPQKRQGPPRKDTPKPKGEGGGKEHH